MSVRGPGLSWPSAALVVYGPSPMRGGGRGRGSGVPLLLWLHDEQRLVVFGDGRRCKQHLLIMALIPQRNKIAIVRRERLARLAGRRHPDGIIEVREIDNLAHRRDRALVIVRRVIAEASVATDVDRRAVAGTRHGRNIEDQVERADGGQ